MPSDSPSPGDLPARLAALGHSLAEREAPERAALDAARRQCESLHARVSAGLAAYASAVESAGAPQLRVELSGVRPDDKHLRSVQFDLRRGRHVGIVTVKSRGEVTLVGPFRAGKVEGPCKSFPFAAGPELDAALGDFLERFLTEAATP